MKLIIKLEIIIFLQKSLSQYVPHQYYNRYYTQAAYFEPFQNEEYSWSKRENIQNRKAHRKRKNYYDYYMSAEIDKRPQRLKCKCICKKYEIKPFQEYEQSDPCCQSYCDNNRDNSNGIYTPIQYPTQYPNTINTEIFTPVQYPSFSIIYPTIDLSEIGKAFPWLTWGVTKPTKIDTNFTTTVKDDKGRTSTSDHRDKTSTIDDRDINSSRNESSIDDIDKTSDSTVSDKRESSTKDIGGKPSTINERNKIMTSDDGYKATTVSDTDFPDKTTWRDDGDRTKAKDDGDRTSATEKLTTESTTTTTTSTSSTTESTLSTSPYEADEKYAKLFHHCSKKKKCFHKNNYCSHKNDKIGRYFENDLVERPTIASYLNGRRRNKIGRYYKENPHYGI